MKQTIFLFAFLFSFFTASAQVQVIITAGQSNTDGRVTEELPSYIKENGYRHCRWCFGSYGKIRTDGFEPYWPKSAHEKHSNSWAYDAVFYYLLEQELKRDFYVIKWSVGGTAIDPSNEQSTQGKYWSANPEWLAKNTSTLRGGKSLLLSFIEEIDQCIDRQLNKLPEGFEVKAFLWHQGESDYTAGPLYYDNLKAVVDYVRQHLVEKTGNEEYAHLPFICGTVSRSNRCYNADVESAMWQLSKDLPNFHVIDMSKGELQSDRLHFTAKSAEYLGQEMFKVYRNISQFQVSAPFEMLEFKEPVFPEKDFNIKDFGAKTDKADNAKEIVAAIKACNAAGGGRVVVPEGEWKTGAIHFLSNVCLHLEKGAVLRFSDNPDDYLPAVPTSWEGMECYNYSPLVYAYECENIAITGEGTLKPKMDLWRKWFSRPQPHLDALKELYTKASTDVPVEERQMAVGENHLRPHLIHFNRCKNVLLDGFKIRESPFWTIHIYLCEGGIARNLDVSAHGHNNDGIDLEMTRNFLVENCTFDQGDDAVVIKSGRNQDAWRLATPSENIVIRNCTINAGHTLLGIGSEMSGSVRNVLMQDCVAPKTVHRVFFAKTNHRRGGFIEDIYMKNIHVGGAINVFEVDTDVLYQWRTLVPTYEERLTRIKGLHLEDIDCDATKALYIIKGDSRLPVSTISLKNIHVGTIAAEQNICENAQWKTFENVSHDKLDPEVLPELTKFISNK